MKETTAGVSASHTSAAEPVVPAITGQVVHGNNTFAVDLYRKLTGPGGNVLFSPYSLSTALAMTYAGARGQTSEEMAAVLHFLPEPAQLHPALHTLAGEVAESSGDQVKIANALWVGTQEKLLETFTAAVQTHYGAGVHRVDYRYDPESARQTINQWVADHTAQKILDLLPPRSVDTSTALVLTNAIYFKGKWLYKFEARATSDAPFTTADGQTVNVPLMSETAKVQYRETAEYQAVELPYEDGALSMLVVLPRESDGLPALEQSTELRRLLTTPSTMQKKEVSVQIPRFRIESGFDLADTLSEMGMPHAFHDADFSAMNGRRDLFISRVIHKAYVDVNEEGTEAAAASGVLMERGRSSRPVPFRADHPFLIAIRDRRTDSILFLGRVARP